MSKDMISAPRELLERICHIYASSPWPAWYELRALLAQPNTCTKDGGQCGLGGYCEPCHNAEPVCTCPSGDGSLRWPCPVHPPEPVAWRFRVSDTSDWFTTTRKDVAEMFRKSPDGSHSEPLYRHPPAQAPVVLPGRKIAADYWNAYEQPFPSEAAGIWNACLDRVKELNP